MIDLTQILIALLQGVTAYFVSKNSSKISHNVQKMNAIDQKLDEIVKEQRRAHAQTIEEIKKSQGIK